MEDLVAADKLTAAVTLFGELPLYENFEKPLFSIQFEGPLDDTLNIFS